MARPSQPAATPPLQAGRVLEEEAAFLGVAKGAQPSSALCFSGGGVRSASFCLGVLQGLSRAGLIQHFDYLSTVSGGGYVGGWLSAWRARARQRGEPDPSVSLGAAEAGQVEPAAVTRLRHLIEFLTPHTGLLSADVWTLAGTMLRNLLVNWLVLLPLLAAIAMLPQLYLGVLGLPSQPELVSAAKLAWWFQHQWMAIGVLIGIATTYAALQLPSLGGRRGSTVGFLTWFLAPVLLTHVCFSVHRYWAADFERPVALGAQLVVSAGGMVLPWIVGGAISGRVWRPWIWAAAATAGAVGRFAAWHAHGVLTALANHTPEAFVVVDLTTSLLMLFVQIAIFIGLASREMTDDDREWWARAAAWIVMSAIVWFAISAVTILGPMAFHALLAWIGLSQTAGRVGLGLGAVAAGLAQRAITFWAMTSAAHSRIKTMAATLAAPALVVLLLILVADANRHLLAYAHNLHWFKDHLHPIGAALPEDLLVLGALGITALLLSQIIAVNRFSLHGMYRARLVRTFLGSSRARDDRQPNGFTGFDASDDLPIRDLASVGKPLHIVNVTLNTVADSGLPTADRKAGAFTMSALHAGAAEVGYRPAAEYGGGLTLGDALTTSGAAVNSNMGAMASPALTFLLTTFNARLGVWLGNPGAPGRRTWFRPSPSFGAGPIVNELLGRTTERNPYVNLSDGGHFENLGLYEMIRRRCRCIVVVDAGADPEYAFGDLALVTRLARVDFGVDIVFPGGLPIGGPDAGPARRRWAVGTIGYRAVDPTAEDGLLLYLKPTLLGDEPIDVANYARTHPPFPHQSTVNQWFDVAHFESYRALGAHTVATTCDGGQFGTPREWCDALKTRQEQNA